MSKEQLAEKLKTVNIFARVIPEQKMLLVNAFKESGLTIAMTGDGVNDAPALKSANIGIAMGERGTDVARETADLVLLNDDFHRSSGRSAWAAWFSTILKKRFPIFSPCIFRSRACRFCRWR